MEETRPVNLMEGLVEAKVDDLMREAGVCGCPVCRKDIIALSLNSLPAKYTSSSSGGIYASLYAGTAQFQADVTAAILAAIATVKSRPRHPGRVPEPEEEIKE